MNPKVCALQAAHWSVHPVVIAVPEGLAVASTPVVLYAVAVVVLRG